MTFTSKQPCRILSYCSIGPVLFFSVFFQSVAAPYMNIMGAIPSVPFVLCILLCLKLRAATVLTVGVICGLCSDLLAGRVIGYDCLLYVYISAGCIVLASRVYCRRLLIKIFIVFFASVLYGIGVSCTRALFFGIWSFQGLFTHAIYNTAIAPLLVMLTGRSVQEPF